MGLMAAAGRRFHAARQCQVHCLGPYHAVRIRQTCRVTYCGSGNEHFDSVAQIVDMFQSCPNRCFGTVWQFGVLDASFFSHNDHSAHFLESEGSAVLLSPVSSNGNNFVRGNHAVSGQFLKSKRSVESEPPWTPKWMLADAMMI